MFIDGGHLSQKLEVCIFVRFHYFIAWMVVFIRTHFITIQRLSSAAW